MFIQLMSELQRTVEEAERNERRVHRWMMKPEYIGILRRFTLAVERFYAGR